MGNFLGSVPLTEQGGRRGRDAWGCRAHVLYNFLGPD